MEETLRQGGFAMDDEIPVDLMEELSAAERDPEEIDRPSISYWNMCWLRLKKDKLAMFGFAVIIVITALAIAVPMLSPYSYDQTDFAHMLEWPSRLHPFGTDKMGRDIFVRTMYGARISLTIGFTAAAINMVIGVFYGGIAGYLGGRTDMIMMRIVDVLSGIPSLLYLILIIIPDGTCGSFLYILHLHDIFGKIRHYLGIFCHFINRSVSCLQCPDAVRFCRVFRCHSVGRHGNVFRNIYKYDIRCILRWKGHGHSIPKISFKAVSCLYILHIHRKSG